MDDILRLEFNEWARAGRGESMERGHRPVGEQAIIKMEVPEDAQVLDVGCGSGWASRLLAERATKGRVVGIDISDEMIRLASETSAAHAKLTFRVASAESLPYADGEFTHAFSMESLYYYANMSQALSEICRVLAPGGSICTVVDLYQENKPSHQWIEQMRVPVQLLSIAEYYELFAQAGFVEIQDERLLDPAPIVEQYTGTSFRSHEDYLAYRKAGSLMLSARTGRRAGK